VKRSRLLPGKECATLASGRPGARSSRATGRPSVTKMPVSQRMDDGLEYGAAPGSRLRARRWQRDGLERRARIRRRAPRGEKRRGRRDARLSPRSVRLSGAPARFGPHSGNYGLRTSRWRSIGWKKNIAAFGGDRARVLAFGQSAGSRNLCTLLAASTGELPFSRRRSRKRRLRDPARERRAFVRRRVRRGCRLAPTPRTWRPVSGRSRPTRCSRRFPINPTLSSRRTTTRTTPQRSARLRIERLRQDSAGDPLPVNRRRERRRDRTHRSAARQRERIRGVASHHIRKRARRAGSFVVSGERLRVSARRVERRPHRLSLRVSVGGHREGAERERGTQRPSVPVRARARITGHRARGEPFMV